jgi:hypothetical protein
MHNQVATKWKTVQAVNSLEGCVRFSTDRWRNILIRLKMLETGILSEIAWVT